MNKISCVLRNGGDVKIAMTPNAGIRGLDTERPRNGTSWRLLVVKKPN